MLWMSGAFLTLLLTVLAYVGGATFRVNRFPPIGEADQEFDCR